MVGVVVQFIREMKKTINYGAFLLAKHTYMYKPRARTCATSFSVL